MIRELEDIAIEAIQNETQKIKAAKKKKTQKTELQLAVEQL